MELRLKRDPLNCYTCKLNRHAEDSFTADVVISDTLPDASSVILSDGDFCLWRLDLSSGSAEAEGEWKGSICYAAESDGTPVRFPVSVGVRLRVSDDLITPELRPYASFHICDVAGQLMNSRKLRMRVRIQMELKLFATGEEDIVTGIENPSEDLQMLTEQQTISYISGVEEQVFTAADQIHLSHDNVTDILCAHSRIRFQPARADGRGAILSGAVITQMLCRGADGSLVSETAETVFSQLLDFSDCSEGDLLLSSLQLTSSDVYLNEAGELHTDFHIVTQTQCVKTKELAILTDVYSVSDALRLSSAPLALHRFDREEGVSESAETSMEIPPESSIVYCTVPTLRAFQTQEGRPVSALSAVVLLADQDGRISARQETIPVSLSVSADRSIQAVNVRQPVVSVAGNMAKVRVELGILPSVVHETKCDQIQEIEYLGSDASREDLPAVTLIRRADLTDLWETAKRYGSTREAIQSANPEFENGDSAYILIPRISFSRS